MEEADATEAVVAAATDPAREYRARHIGGTDLWSVAAFSLDGAPCVGTFTVVGPDRRVWSFSSNPGLHDSDLVVTVLEALYRERLTPHVTEEALSDRIQGLTEERANHVRALVREALAGELRRGRPRTLP